MFPVGNHDIPCDQKGNNGLADCALLWFKRRKMNRRAGNEIPASMRRKGFGEFEGATTTWGLVWEERP